MTGKESYKNSLKKAMAMCAGSEHCISEVSAKLRSWGTGDPDITRIIGILKKDNFINEDRYALSYVSDKFRYNKWGRVKIASHLKAKNIDGQAIKKALDSIDSDYYKKTLEGLLSAHRRTVKAKNQYDLKAKLMRYGLSKGFESSLLYELLNESEE